MVLTAHESYVLVLFEEEFQLPVPFQYVEIM